MSTVNELLGLSEAVDETIIVDISTRSIKIPPTLAFIGVESDDGVKRLYFKMPRYYGEFDLAQFEFRINLLNAVKGGDSVKIKDMKYGTDEITFTWLPERFVFVSKGDVEFNLCLRKLSGSGEDAEVVKEFNTTRASLPVLQGLETVEQVMEAYPDLVQAWQEELFGRFSGRIDQSLTISGQAADAAVVGQRFEELTSRMNMDISTIIDELRQKASSADLATERSRINQLIAGATSVDANAEMTDIRVGLNGKVYETAGDAVREQVKNIRASVFDESLFTFTDIEAGNGYLKTDYTLYADETWFTSDFIEIAEYCSVEYALEEYATLPHMVFYDANKNVISCILGSVSGKLTQNTAVAPENAAYLRYVMYIKDGIDRLASQFVHISNDLVSENKRQLTELEDRLFTKREILYDAELETNGYLRTDDVLITDSNWYTSDYIEINPYDVIEYAAMGHSVVSSVTIYDENHKVLERVVGNTNNVIVNGSIIAPKSSKYMRYVFSYMGHVPGESTQKIVITRYNVISAMKEVNIEDDSFIYPRCIYTVANDFGSEGGHNRNYSAALYLDHHFNGLNKEYPLRYDNGMDKKVFFSPIQVEDSNETNPALNMNKGERVLETTNNIRILHDGDTFKSFDIIHRSTLNSAGSNGVPIQRILCIGDSITYGELATMPDDNFESNYAYHLLAAELFKKDMIDSGNETPNCIFLGTMKRTRNMEYGGDTYVITTHHEGRRGWSYSTYMKEGSPFYDAENDKFSILKWIDTYRTLDDEGNRLMVGNGTGTAITDSNINEYDVCTPTHVVIMLGTNGGQTTEQYKKMVDDIKSEYPEMIIALAVSDSAGTYFPSLHPHTGDELTFWNDSKGGTQAGRHNTMFTCMKNIIDEFDNEVYENDKVYVLPFYFVQPTAESCSMRVIDSLVCEFEIFKESERYISKYGWCPTTHINGAGHATWAYQLYSWLRYTFANSISGSGV